MTALSNFIANNRAHTGVETLKETDTEVVLDVSAASSTVQNMVKHNAENRYEGLRVQKGYDGNENWWAITLAE